MGLLLGLALSRIEALESLRGDFAAWLLMGFGFIYFFWGLIIVIKKKTHSHLHFHKDGMQHNHEHFHVKNHSHTHDKEPKKTITPWILFIIFVFGPCEPLIPILMYPAFKNSIIDLMLVIAIFSMVTIVTMLSVVLAVSYGLNILPLEKMEPYLHPMAGLMIGLSGMAIVFLGL